MSEQTREEVIEQRVVDFQHCFSGPHGKRTLVYISTFCLEKQSTFSESCGRKTDFNEGARAVMLEIRRWLEYDLTKLDKEQSNVQEDRTG